MDQSIQIETYILKKLVDDLDRLKHFPSEYLVSIRQHPAEAEKILSSKPSNAHFYLDGVIRIHYKGKDVIPFTYWDDLNSLWPYMLNVLEEYFENGEGFCYFPDTPILIKMKKHRRDQLMFTVDPTTIVVDERMFIDSLLEEAIRFFAFLERATGVKSPYEMNQITALTSRS